MGVRTNKTKNDNVELMKEKDWFNAISFPLNKMLIIGRFYRMATPKEMKEAFYQWLVNLRQEHPNFYNERLGKPKARQIASYYKVSAPTAESWIEKRTFPSAETIYRICEVEGITTDEFFKRLQELSMMLTLKNSKAKEVNADQIIALAKKLSLEEMTKIGVKLVQMGAGQEPASTKTETNSTL